MALLIVSRGRVEEELPLSLDLDGNGGIVVQLHSLDRAVRRHDPVAVASARLRGVVRPLEALERVFRGADGSAGREPPVLVPEPLDPGHPVALDHVGAVQLLALDREAEEAGSPVLLSFH